MSIEDKSLYQQCIDAMNAEDITVFDRIMDSNIGAHELPSASLPDPKA